MQNPKFPSLPFFTPPSFTPEHQTTKRPPPPFGPSFSFCPIPSSSLDSSLFIYLFLPSLIIIASSNLVAINLSPSPSCVGIWQVCPVCLPRIFPHISTASSDLALTLEALLLTIIYKPLQLYQLLLLCSLFNCFSRPRTCRRHDPASTGICSSKPIGTLDDPYLPPKKATVFSSLPVRHDPMACISCLWVT